MGNQDNLLLFVVASVLLALTPGPNMLYLISRTLAQGRAAGLISLVGTTTGLVVHVLAAALGLSAVLVALPVAYDALRWAGAAYLLWLAWDAVRPAADIWYRQSVADHMVAQLPVKLSILPQLGELKAALN